MIVDRAIVPDVIVIPASSVPLQMVYYTLIDVPLANVYLDYRGAIGQCLPGFPYYLRTLQGVSSPVYPVIIGNVHGVQNYPLRGPASCAKDLRFPDVFTGGTLMCLQIGPEKPDCDSVQS